MAPAGASQLALIAVTSSELTSGMVSARWAVVAVAEAVPALASPAVVAVSRASALTGPRIRVGREAVPPGGNFESGVGGTSTSPPSACAETTCASA